MEGIILELTSTELEILEELANGKYQKEIAQEKNITKKECSKIIKKICEKIGAVNKIDAIVKVLKEGLITVK